MAARPKSPNTRQRRSRGSITAEEVVLGALEVCQAETVDGLNMLGLAQHLGLGVTSIYWYFKSKDDLLDAMTDEAFRRFYGQVPSLEGLAWDDVLRKFFHAFREIFRNDDVLCDLIIVRNGSSSAESATLSWTRIEQILEVLVDAGFSEDSASYAYFSLSVYTRGSVFIERMARKWGIDPAVGRYKDQKLVATMPVLSRELPAHSWLMVSDDDFDFGIENAIRGLRPLLAADRKVARESAGAPADSAS